MRYQCAPVSTMNPNQHIQALNRDLLESRRRLKSFPRFPCVQKESNLLVSACHADPSPLRIGREVRGDGFEPSNILLIEDPLSLSVPSQCPSLESNQNLSVFSGALRPPKLPGHRERRRPSLSDSPTADCSRLCGHPLVLRRTR